MELDLDLRILAICRLDADSPIPGWADTDDSSMTSITRTPDELSIVTAAAAVPDGIRSEGGWRALRVRGPLDFNLIGVLAAIAGPLAAADVAIFVISTFDTDWVLVRDHSLDRAIEALEGAGHVIHR